ncbi:hypothetical protein CRYUN_Cryun03dG0114700 [Craigia yunnanensis]
MQSLGLTPNKATLPLVLKACAKLNAIETRNRIHLSIQNTNFIEDVGFGTVITDFYRKCGFLEDARKVFDGMGDRDLVSWNAMMSGYAECGEFEEVVFLVMKMQKEGFRPNSLTLVVILLVPEEVVEVRLRNATHGYCLRNRLFDLDPHVGTAFIGFYLSFDVRALHLVFALMVVRNTVCWNAMIIRYFDAGEFLKALKLFEKMLMDGVEVDSVTVLAVIQASAEFGSLELADGVKKGKSLHAHASKSGMRMDINLGNAMLNMYAEKIEWILSKSEAWEVFGIMRESDAKPNSYTIISILAACKDETSLNIERSIHGFVLKQGIEVNVPLSTALTDMSINCDDETTSRNLFESCPNRDLISWNALIATYVKKTKLKMLF